GGRHMILRKVSAALRLLSSEEPTKALAKRMHLNMRAALLTARRGKPLIYRHSNGFPFVVTQDIPETRSIYLNRDSYEKVESAVIASWLGRGETAIDCGSNVGLMTALMAGSVGDDGCVISIEASPDTCGRLDIAMSILGLKQVKTFNRCVCDQDG